MKAKIMIAVLLCLLVLPIAFAAFPGNWWGKVYIKGEKVPDGTPVNAYINDKLVATTNVGDKLGSGYYELFIEGNAGDTIIFKIGSVEAGTAVFSDGAHPQLDLNLTESACGDTLCNGDETCSTCPGDCGACPPSGGIAPSGGGGEGGISCTPVWQCTAWTTCSQARTQTRTCTDKNKCGTTTGKPIEIQSCNYIPPKTTTTQEEETPVEPETISGEVEPVTIEEPPVTEEVVDNKTEGLGGITGWFLQNVTGSNKWIGIIILILLAGLLFYFFVIKKKRKKSKHTKD